MQSKFEVHLSEKETANYFSNAAALYVLGVGFAYFSYRAQSPFMGGVCFWFSLFLLCDCLRLARVCVRLGKTGDLLLSADEQGITHFTSWLEPERISWKDVTGFRYVKGMQNETAYIQVKSRNPNFFRVALFGAPKFDLPLACVKGGKEGLLRSLESYPAAAHLVPTRTSTEVLPKAA
jgi:hypothetical protein